MIEELLKYQQVDTKLRKIETELSNSEERKKAVVAKKYLASVDELVEKLEVRAGELIAAYEQVSGEQVKLQEQSAEFDHALNAVADETEAEYLLKKAEELISKIKSLGQEANKINGEIRSVLNEYANIVNKRKSATVQFNEYGAKYAKLKDSKADEIKSIEDELKTLSKNVEPSLMERYLKKRAEKIFPIVFEVNDKNCGACGMELSMVQIADLKSGKIIECDNCRKLLYLKQ